MSISFLPRADADRVTWLVNFNSRLPQYAQQLGLTAAELAIVQHDTTAFSQVVQFNEAVHQYAKVVSEIKNQYRNASQQVAGPVLPALPALPAMPAGVNSGIFNRITILASRIRQHAAYTQAMGEDLGIVFPDTSIDFNTLAPELTIRLDAGHPLLHWKKGPADGVAIYVDRRDGNGFVHLIDTVKTAYLDTSGLPANTFSATWDYKIRYFIGDDEVGLFSSVTSVNVIIV